MKSQESNGIDRPTNRCISVVCKCVYRISIRKGEREKPRGYIYISIAQCNRLPSTVLRERTDANLKYNLMTMTQRLSRLGSVRARIVTPPPTHTHTHSLSLRDSPSLLVVSYSCTTVGLTMSSAANECLSKYCNAGWAEVLTHMSPYGYANFGVAFGLGLSIVGAAWGTFV